ncbi:Imm6 family immunity protein [Herbaspirillum rubrisubalbicans]|uniref:Uncharacterized protein n=1 Tax=Herbaspirillum rubrisubalbicans Os34 TaxID=1235827 RepID=A0A6M3ZQ97_9BURK|nr:hypothetical protein [Herbaspirillum rubrisubalbicans]QJQ00180.1 hypothetical protein C798_08030 [Herbaspirillum rubrisubalbicans Os34]
MINGEKILRDIPLSNRLDALLRAADIANEVNRVSHPNTFCACRQAIQKCRDWLDKKEISPEALAEYVDADGDANPWMQESIFKPNSSGLQSLIFITMVVGHVAHFSYLRVGDSEKMSEAVTEAGDNVLKSIAEYGEKYGLDELIQRNH